MSDHVSDPVARRQPRISFDPDFALTSLPRATLAVLGREWLMHGHLQDRVGIPLVLQRFQQDPMLDVAIVEWMAASPVYSRRMQRALQFAGDGVDTIFKNMKFDVGAPHRFLDFRMTVHDHDHGEFHLDHCGALMDVEPMGEEMVRGMCHTIEDPTFDATAVATNPRAQVRPIHRPPRMPADRHPHCHWTVTIDANNPPVEPHPYMAVVEQSHAARCVIAADGAPTEPGGWDDLTGPFDPDLEFEDLSQPALVVALQEIALQSDLLLRGFCLAVADLDPPSVTEFVPKILVGLAGVTSYRLCRAFDFGSGAEAIAALLQVHPLFWPPTYIATRIECDDDRVRLGLLADSPMFAEGDDYTWLSSLPGEGERALTALVRELDVSVRVTPVEARADERCAYEFWFDRDAAAGREEPEVSLGKFSSGANFPMISKRPVRT